METLIIKYYLVNVSTRDRKLEKKTKNLSIQFLSTPLRCSSPMRVNLQGVYCLVVSKGFPSPQNNLMSKMSNVGQISPMFNANLSL